MLVALPFMEEDRSNSVNVIGFLAFSLAAGLMVVFVPVIGVFAGLGVIIVGYLIFGHHVVSLLIDMAFRGSSFTQEDIRADFGRRIARLVKKNRAEQAVEECRKWIRHDREHAEPYIRMSWLIADVGQDPEQAVRQLELVILRKFTAEQHIAVAGRLAELYRRTGKEPLIAPMFQKVREAHANSPHVRNLVP